MLWLPPRVPRCSRKLIFRMDLWAPEGYLGKVSAVFNVLFFFSELLCIGFRQLRFPAGEFACRSGPALKPLHHEYFMNGVLNPQNPGKKKPNPVPLWAAY